MNIIKVLLYLGGGALITPGAMLAYFMWSVDEATRQKNIFTLFFFVLARILDTLVWAISIVAPCLLVWLALAFWPKYRFVGASGMAIVAVVSLVESIVVAGWPKPDEMFFPAMSMTGLAISGWLIWSQWPAAWHWR